MTNDEREALIKKAAKAIWEESVMPGKKDQWGDEPEYVMDEYCNQARAALAVFEQAHTPTDGERGGCGCTTRQVRYVDGEWARELELIPCETHRRPVQGSENFPQNSDEHVVTCAKCGQRPVVADDAINSDIVICDRCAFTEGRESVQAKPTEVDADPDTAFELGRVAGYDEAMREVQAEPSDAQLADIESRVYDAHRGQVAGMAKEMVRAGWRAAFQGGSIR